MAQGDFSQGSSNDPNRIDVSLNIISDAAMSAVKQLTAELAELRQFVASQTKPDAAGRAVMLGGGATSARASAYTARSAETGVFHDVSPAQTGETPNPSATREDRRREEAEKLAQAYKSYVSNVQDKASGENPNAIIGHPSAEVEDLMEMHMGVRERWRFHKQELQASRGMPDGVQGPRLGRFLDVSKQRDAAKGEDRTYYDVVGDPTGPAGRPSGMGPHMTIPRSGQQTIQDKLQLAAEYLGGSGQIGSGTAPDYTTGLSDWERGLARSGIDAETRQAFTIPRLGEYTIQDKLNMAAQGMGGWAARRAKVGREQDPTYTSGRGLIAAGRAAQGAQLAADNSAMLYALQAETRRGIMFNRGQESAGEMLGFSRESQYGDVNLGPLGVRIAPPWASEAGAEGWRQQISKLRLGAKAGISLEEAGRIRGITNEMGYSGEMGRAMTEDVLGPLQQQGISPEAVAPMADQMLRHGNFTPEQIRRSFEDLNKSAQALNLTVGETSEAFKEYTESMQSQGGDLGRATRNANAAAGVGLDPRLLNQMLQNDFTKGNLMMGSGLPPQMMGATSFTEQGKAIQQSYEMANNMSEVFANDEYTTGADGRRIKIRTGREKQRAFIQQQTDIPVEVQKRMERNKNWLTDSAAASDILEQYEGRFEGATREKGYIDAVERGGGSDRGSRRELSKVVTEKRGEITKREREALMSGGGDKANWEDVEAKMRAMDPSKAWQKKIDRVAEEDDPEKQRKRAREIIQNANRTKDPDRVKLDLTPDAKRLVKQMGGRKNRSRGEEADGGGGAKNALYQGANFAWKAGSDVGSRLGGINLGVPFD